MIFLKAKKNKFKRVVREELNIILCEFQKNSKVLIPEG
jgi:hypothetical protein